MMRNNYWSVLLGIACLPLILSKSGDAVGIRERWDIDRMIEQKDQGRWGTCHAFALTPSIELYENKKIAQDEDREAFRVSENWLVFLSVLDRICAPPELRTGAVRINQGWKPERDLRSVVRMGYCAKDKFIHYDASDLRKNARDTSGISPLEFWNTLQEKESALFKGNPQPEKPERDEDVAEYTRTHFLSTFGVSVEEARTLCANENGDPPVEALIAKIKAEPEAPVGERKNMVKRRLFAECLAESAVKRKQMAEDGCHAKKRVWQNNDENKQAFMDWVASQLEAGTPIITSMRNYPDGRENKTIHREHAFNMVEYNPARETFYTRNSWGANSNHPVPLTAISNIDETMVLLCPKQKLPEQPKFAVVAERRRQKRAIGELQATPRSTTDRNSHK